MDGFRIDAFNFIYEDKRYPDEPRSNKSFVDPEDYDYYIHKYSINQPETITLAQEWRSVLEKYSRKGSTR